MSVPGLLVNPFAWAWRLLRTEAAVLGRYPNQALVLELGTEEPGEIARYLRYLKPDIGVITAVTPEHMQNFPGGLDQVAEEELTLAKGSKVIIVNADAVDQKYRHKYLSGHARALTYSLKGQKHLPDTPHVLGHMRASLLAADLVARELKVPEAKIERAIEHIKPVAGRMNPLDGANGSRLIDDTYNSSPAAVEAALDTLKALRVPRGAHKIAVLGDMLELGRHSVEEHRKLGARAAKRVDMLVVVGVRARDIAQQALDAGMDEKSIMQYDDAAKAGEELAAMVREGDCILIKGSQSIRMERAVLELMKRPEEADKLLVRQDLEWKRR